MSTRGVVSKSLYLSLSLILLAPACASDEESVEVAPVTEAVLLGAPPMAPLPAGEKPVLARSSTRAGDLDVDLQEIMHAPGLGRWAVVGADETPETVLARMAGAREHGTGALSYVGVVTAAGHYLVEVDNPKLFEAFRGVTEAAPGPGMPGPLAEAQDDALVPYGWSNGFDSRQRLTGNNVPHGLGLVAGSGQCSGALIGRRIVRTAAHCVVVPSAAGGSVVASARFDYRRDAGSTPISATTGAIIYGGAFLPSGCAKSIGNSPWAGYGNNFDACTWSDWAFLILPNNWHGNQFVSWFGYKGLVNGDLNLELQSGGYPGCGLPESPVNGVGCVNQAYYRDQSAPCTVGQFTNGTAKWKVGCDISPGNSGGPVWQEGTGYLIGHAQWQECGTCSVGATPNPNHYLGHDDWLFNFQNELRATYP